MIVPSYWAQAKTKGRVRDRAVTITRFGWSDESEAAAQAHAQQRADQALAGLTAGEKLSPRELKTPYNGATGVPIREEVVERRGEAVLTRNSYGALCINTPDVLFADIDFPDPPRAKKPFMFSLLAVAIVLGLWLHAWGIGILLVVAALFISTVLGRVNARRQAARTPDPEAAARARAEAFVAAHPDWHLRLYRTPAGLRALAMHRPFAPDEAAVAECFRALGTDSVYVQMCLNQQCFRARVSPKPWRAGVATHIKPRPGVWPVDPARLPERARWIKAYEAATGGFASCRFIVALGSGVVSPAAREVQQWHDELARAESKLPLA